MNILVTGGAGYIGSHVCTELLICGHKVIAIDNLSNSNISSLQNVSKIAKVDLNIDPEKDSKFIFIYGDIRHEEVLEKIFYEHNIHTVLHFAGLKSVGDSVKNPDDYFSNNVDGSINLLNVMKRFNCKTIVFSSSATVYGKAKINPINESSKLLPTNPYGESKKLIEDFLRKQFKEDPNWRIAILRYFNPIGAHKSSLIGERSDDIPNNLLPYILKVATGEKKTLNIYGNDYETLDGTGVRDYIHVMDLVDGHLKSIKILEDKPQLLVVNLGTGFGYSVLEVVKAFEKVTQKKINYEFKDRREGDVAISYADPHLALKLLNWKAKYNLEDMCLDSWKFKLKQ
jgi:UDP-glucose 4-epimerase